MIVQIDVDDTVFGSIVVSITEFKIIIAISYCTQLLWMNQMLEDYGIV